MKFDIFGIDEKKIYKQSLLYNKKCLQSEKIIAVNSVLNYATSTYKYQIENSGTFSVLN